MIYREEIVKRVLIVDDNINDRTVLAYYISRYFLCDIYTASNGRDALDRIDAISPDVIITDISMPVMNGIQFILELNRSKRNIPVLALSAVNEKSVIDQLKNLEILNHLDKPVNSFRIYKSLEKIFSYPSA